MTDILNQVQDVLEAMEFADMPYGYADEYRRAASSITRETRARMDIYKYVDKSLLDQAHVEDVFDYYLAETYRERRAALVKVWQSGNELPLSQILAWRARRRIEGLL